MQDADWVERRADTCLFWLDVGDKPLLQLNV